MRFALLLLWLTALAPAAHAADWLTWRRVGEATLTWGPFTVYMACGWLVLMLLFHLGMGRRK
ncbi:hypothetical protein EWE77_27960 [Klebsiella pneumoniae]|nr:hypothetical protein [Klebsiella pneumoniae]